MKKLILFFALSCLSSTSFADPLKLICHGTGFDLEHGKYDDSRVFHIDRLQNKLTAETVYFGDLQFNLRITDESYTGHLKPKNGTKYYEYLVSSISVYIDRLTASSNITLNFSDSTEKGRALFIADNGQCLRAEPKF